MIYLKQFFNTMFGKILLTFLISMVPVIELRIAVPFALGCGLNLWTAIPVAIIGNLVPVPFIIIFIRKIFTWLRTKSQKLDKLVCKLEARAEKKSDVVNKYAFWGLFVLVAIPLPGTGAWTGALVAALLEIPLKKTFPAIALGVVAAGIVVSFLFYGAASLLFS